MGRAKGMGLGKPLLVVFSVAFLLMVHCERAPAKVPQLAEKEGTPIGQIHYSIYLGDLSGTNRNYVRLDVLRAGKVYYHFASDPSTDSGGKVVDKAWNIPEKEAAALLDAVAGQLRKLKTDAKGKPSSHCVKLGDRLNDRDEKLVHAVDVAALPAAIANQLLPLLQKAHPELWKQKDYPSNWKVLP